MPYANGHRRFRDQLLETEVDPISSKLLMWESKSDSEKALWRNYRQALLDITDQEGFPETVTWPTKPE